MNRKKLMLLNSAVVLMTTIVNIIFGMIEVSLFISTYGPELNGLKQTGGQLLAYLSLIEAGIGASYMYSFYKPIASGDYDKISALYCGFKIIINKVVLKMMAVALAISFVYPLFLRNNGLSYWMMVSVFTLLSIKTIVPYFFSYVPKYLIIAKEQRYKAELITCLSNAVTYIIEIVLLMVADISIQLLLLVCVVISIMTGFIYQRVMRKLYGPNLKKNVLPDITPQSMSKDVFAHNVSGLVFNSTDNVIISIFSSLNAVTIYSNYNLIVSQVSTVFQHIFDGATASFGIKIANHDDNSYIVYRELFSGTQFISSIISSVFIVMINDFITIWVGAEYSVTLINCCLFGYILYCNMLLPCISAARNACGLYKESRNFTIIQAIINLLITIALTPFIGITGALIGTLLARACISVPCNYYLVDKKVFPKEKSRWIELIFGAILVGAISLVNIYLYNIINLNSYVDSHLISFCLNAFIVTLSSTAISFVYYYLTNNSFKHLLRILFINKSGKKQ